MKKVSIFLLSVIVLFNVNQVQASYLKSPIVSEISVNLKNLEEPFITGFTEIGTEVLVYLDNIYIGSAKVENINKPLESFSFYIDRLPTTGEHNIFLIAKNYSGELSPQTRNFKIYVNTNITAPTIYSFDNDTLKGRVESGNLVHIYVDGKYDGSTLLLLDKKGIVEFTYKLKSSEYNGKSDIYVTATDLAGRVSGKSNVINSVINLLPSPTITDLNLYKYNKTEISGVSFNDTKIEIFIDDKFDGVVDVVNSDNGVGTFSYKSLRPLTIGFHTIYTRAVDKNGRTSLNSLVRKFEVLNIPQISKEAVVEEKSDNIEVLGQDNIKIEEDVDINPTEDVKEIIDSSNKPGVTTTTSSLDESKDDQNKLKLNLIIFLGFLLAVIAWIIWVNKELVKERNNTDDENI